MSKKPLGPGPGAYALPPTLGYIQHDPRKPRLPNYSFRAQTALKLKGIGPGPGKYHLENHTRYGKVVLNNFHLGKKLPIRERSKGPGPAAPDVYKGPIMTGPSAPAWRMTFKNNYRFKNNTPGPNIYLPLMKLYKPTITEYSIGLLNKVSEKTRSPGPAAYGATKQTLTKYQAPQYSMAEHCSIPSKQVSPGANTYNLAQYHPGTKAPVYGFGLKHSEYAPPMIVECDN